MSSASRFWLGVLFFVLVGVVFVGVTGVTWNDVQHIFGPPRNALSINGENVEIPLPEGDAERLLPAVQPTTTGDYSFMFVEDGEPVRWDPCRPVYFVINPEGAPPGAENLIFEAIDSMSQSTGLLFEFEGYTTEVASFDRDLIQEEQYGEEFVPLIFGWSTEGAYSALDGTVAGMGGSSSVPGAYGDQRYLVGGVIILDGPDIATMMATNGRRALALAVIKHELGHVVGLGHVDDSTELMNPTNSTLRDWGPGDLEGLALAGAGPCQAV